ncbi:TPA: hypothetical protein KOS69_000958 [Clostridioides difficile]|uniref:hypothetical protein n=2 Tax=Clostridioides difficile TaxID=1496 RepID=UPI00093BEADF|nr:hypothetical protein [Clostridioides difficile]EGT5472951.1 hypothetical protein [Clostridioides difficile]ELX4590879.1 hypothetical protein [Clostridioides difficile]MBG0254888.1 hypothetical protein [Clostridioides difficile]MBH7538340.1 hypothetical protein [Clostridioides difficile]MBH7844580.1 hypothetical protein [Clostridioides difficile]
MKVDKTINFLNGFKKTKPCNKIYKIIIVLILTCILFKSFMYVKSINELEDYISQNKLVDKSKNTLPTTDKTREKFSKIKLNEIKKIYETIGINSITKISIDKNKLEIEGVCSDLDVLNNLRKIKCIKYYYIDSIVRDGEYYRFRIKS